MLSIEICGDREAWDDFVLERGGHPLQLWGWGQVKSAHGWSADRVFVYQNDKIIAGAQILLRPLPSPFKSFAYVPRGPVGSLDDTVLNELAAFVKREHGSAALSIEPHSLDLSLPDGWVRAENKVLPAETILLDLNQSESDLLAVMAKKTRQYIRKSASDVEVRQVKSTADLDTCLDIYKQTAERAGFALHGDQYYRDIFTLMGDHSPIFAAYVDGAPVAFLWLAISEDIAFELYGGVTSLGQELRANYALKWHVVRKMKEWGLTSYDFGGLIEGGVSTFKQGWSDNDSTLVGTYDKPLSPLYAVWSKGLPLAKKIIRKIKR